MQRIYFFLGKKSNSYFCSLADLHRIEDDSMHEKEEEREACANLTELFSYVFVEYGFQLLKGHEWLAPYQLVCFMANKERWAVSAS